MKRINTTAISYMVLSLTFLLDFIYCLQAYSDNAFICGCLFVTNSILVVVKLIVKEEDRKPTVAANVFIVAVCILAVVAMNLLPVFTEHPFLIICNTIGFTIIVLMDIVNTVLQVKAK